MAIGRAVRALLQTALVVGMLALAVAMHRWFLSAAGKPVPLSQSVAIIAVGFVAAQAIGWMRRRGWLRPSFGKGSEIEERQRELAMERERIIEEAKARLSIEAGPGAAPSGVKNG